MGAYSPGAKMDVVINVSVQIVIGTFALILNLLVVILILRYRWLLLQNIKNMFIFSMASADLLVGVFGIVNQVLKYLYLASRTLESMDTWKLLGVLPFFGSAFMSIFSIGIMTADTLISVQKPLQYHSIMSLFRAKVLIILTWVATAAIIFIQGVIYLAISPKTEWVTRLYLLTVFVFTGGVFLAIANTKLYLVVRAILRRTSAAGSPKTKDGSDSKQDCKKPNTRRLETTASMKTKIHYHSELDGEVQADLEKRESQRNRKPNIGEPVTTIIQPNSSTSSTEPSALMTKSHRERKEDHLHSRTKQTESVKKTKVCIWMTAVFIISWGPFMVYSLLVATTSFKGTINLSTFFLVWRQLTPFSIQSYILRKESILDAIFLHFIVESISMDQDYKCTSEPLLLRVSSLISNLS